VYLYSLFNLDATWEEVVNTTLRRFYFREREPLPIVQPAGWGPGPVWTHAENLALQGFGPGIFKPLASRYRDRAISAHTLNLMKRNYCCLYGTSEIAILHCEHMSLYFVLYLTLISVV
jgi:hypothetical protein